MSFLHTYGTYLIFPVGLGVVLLMLYAYGRTNIFFKQYFRRYATISIALIGLPALTLLMIRNYYTTPELQKFHQSIQKDELNKYTKDIVIPWRDPRVNEKVLASMQEVISRRLEKAKKNVNVKSYISEEGPVTVLEHVHGGTALSPELLQRLLPNNIPHISDDIGAFSVRTVTSEEESLAQIHHATTMPLNSVRMPWKNSYIYVNKDMHVNEHHVYAAERRTTPQFNSENHTISLKSPGAEESTLILYLTEQGRKRMDDMTQYTKNAHQQVAVLYNGKVIGVFIPHPSISDQIWLSDIYDPPADVDVMADYLSFPNRFGPAASKFIYVTDTKKIKKDLPQPLKLACDLTSDKMRYSWLIWFVTLEVGLIVLFSVYYLRSTPKHRSRKLTHK